MEEHKIKMRDEKLTLTVEEAAELTGIGKSLMYEWANSKGFPMIRVGRRILIIKSKFTEWLENNIGHQF